MAGDTTSARVGGGGSPEHSARGVPDIFVTKLSADGSTVLYTAYVGGLGREFNPAMAVDADGHAYVTGTTSSPDFPVVNAVQPRLGGSLDAFVVKLDTTGSALLYSTYLGGSGVEVQSKIAVDRRGRAYVTGLTGSVDFPTVGAIQASLAGDRDVFVSRLDPTGRSLEYSTFLGGRDLDSPGAITVDADGQAIVGGYTFSTDFPTRNALQPRSGGSRDAFVAKLSADGSRLLFSTYLGGVNEDEVYHLAIDAIGQIYLAGDTASPDFPTVRPAQPQLGGDEDGWVAKLSADGSRLLYSTFLGGGEEDVAFGIAVDASGNAWVTGHTFSDDFPTVNPLQSDLNGVRDAFVAHLDPTGALLFSTYLGGRGDDRGVRIALDRDGNVWVAGTTSSDDFPTRRPVQSTFAGGESDAFVAMLSPGPIKLIVAALGPSTGAVGSPVTLKIVVTNQGPRPASGVTLTLDLPATARVVSTALTHGRCAGSGQVVCDLGRLTVRGSATINVVVTPTTVGPLTTVASVTAIGFEPDLGNRATARFTTIAQFRATDPGPRSGAPAVGGPIDGLTGRQLEFFLAGKGEFEDVETVSSGLGPRMNLDSCAGCHSHPASGGSSPFVNPQVPFAGKDGGTDRVPFFITVNGPVREVRFKYKADGTRDGGVHNTATITGRPGTSGCVLAQPDFESQAASDNLAFRIPTPLFGAGLIEFIPDSLILANQAADASAKKKVGILGRVNRGNDGTVARFGWKAQNPSLLMFSGEAYNVEMGITSDLFQSERESNPACEFVTRPDTGTDPEISATPDGLSTIEKFAFFQRFLAPPTPSATAPGGAASIVRGSDVFAKVGCGLCHTSTLSTGNTPRSPR